MQLPDDAKELRWFLLEQYAEKIKQGIRRGLGELACDDAHLDCVLDRALDVLAGKQPEKTIESSASPDRFNGYLYLTGLFCAREYHRYLLVRKTSPLSVSDLPVPSAQDDVIRDETKSILLAAIEELDQWDRNAARAVFDCVWLGVPRTEVAERMGVSVQQVNALVFGGCQRIHELLENNGYYPDDL